MSKFCRFRRRALYLLSILLAITILIPPTPTSAASMLPTSPSAWAAGEVEQAQIAGLIPGGLSLGYTDNTTRREFCILVIKMVETKTGRTAEQLLMRMGLVVETEIFSDTSEPAILAANALGIVNGIGGGLFDPAGTLQRQQAAAMLARAASALGFEMPNDTAVVFADRQEFADYAAGPIAFVSACMDRNSSKRVMGGTGNSQFSPTGAYTREQAIVTMLRLYNAFDYAAPPSSLVKTGPLQGLTITGGVLRAGNLLYDFEPDAPPAVTYQWMRGDSESGAFTAISGATGTTYTVASSDLGKFIRLSVRVSGSAAGEAASAPVKISQLTLQPLRPIEEYHMAVSGLFAGGKGTQAEPYLIADAEDFLLLDGSRQGLYYKLERDIALQLSGGSVTLRGHLDGNGKTITLSGGYPPFNWIDFGASVNDHTVCGNITVDIGFKGIFAPFAVMNSGTITRCSVEDIRLWCDGVYDAVIGGLTAVNTGTIRECFSTGQIYVKASNHTALNETIVGGLAGINDSGATVVNSYSHMSNILSDPFSSDYCFNTAGGLVGLNRGRVLSSYSMGAVSKERYCGGLVGRNEATEGITPIVSNSYYDKNTSGRGDTGKGIPKSTSAMTSAGTFTGWAATLWDLGPYYPLLEWQHTR